MHKTVRRFDLSGVQYADGVLYTYRDVTDQFEATERLEESERRYRLLAEHSSDVVFVVDADVILWASPSSLDQLGWAPDELVGRRWDSMIYGPDTTAMRLPDEPGRRRVRRTRFVHRDGTVHWAELVLADLVDPDGNDEETVVSARNVDAEAEAQAAQHEASRQRDRLIEQLPLGVFRARTDGGSAWRLDFMSPQCAELLRCPPGTNDVATVMSCLEPNDVQRLYEVVKASTLAQAGLTCDVRLAGVTPEVWLRVRANTDVGPGRSIVVDGTVADVSAERAAAVRLASEAAEAAERAEELAAIDRTRAALLAAAGHDLRTPLTVAASAVSGLRQPNLPAEERSELLDNVAASVERLVTTLTDLLDLSRSEAGALPVRLTPVPVLETLEQPLRGMGSGVVLDLPEDLPDVLADASLLERVLDNLLRNADRHRPPGTAVTVAARVEGGRVLLQVIDHGPGVPPEQYEAMFAPFQHLTEGGSGGLGLGLSIARAFTMAMHGRLTPSETPGGGLTMTLDLSAV